MWACHSKRVRLLTPRRFLGTYHRVRNSSKRELPKNGRVVLGGQAWVSVQPIGDVRAHACLGSPISDIPFGHLGVIESMEMVNVAPGKRTLINWERHNWVESLLQHRKISGLIWYFVLADSIFPTNATTSNAVIHHALPSSADGPYIAGTFSSFSRRYTVNCPRWCAM